MLTRSGLGALACSDMHALCHAVGDGVGVILLAEEALTQMTLALLGGLLSAQPPWSDVPVVLFTSGRRPRDGARAERIVEALGNVVIVERPVQEVTLLMTVQNALRARKRQYAVAQVLEDLAARERDAVESMRFMQQLLGIVSHDLRNPISAVVISAEALLRRQDLTQRQTNGVVRIRNAAQRANAMVLDLLDLTRARLGRDMPLHRSTVDLGALADELLDEVRAAHPEREINLHVAGETTGHWDSGRLAQVLQNLATNALQYSPPSTAVTLRVQGTDPDGVTVWVHNVGEPLSPELQSRIFEPMERGHGGPSPPTSPESRSVGLGLYIVKQIVKAHAGSIAIESSEETGTAFVVKLPRA